MENVRRKKKYKQVCVWQGTLVGSSEVKKFEKFIITELKTRAQYLEEIKTFPDVDEKGNNIEGTKGK